MAGVEDGDETRVASWNASTVAVPPELTADWEELPADRVAQLRGFGVWDSGDVEAWLDLFSSDCEFRSLLTDRVEGPAAFNGHDGLKAFWKSQKEIWEDQKHTSERAWRRERLIIVAGHQQVRAKGSGAEVEMRVAFLSERDAEGKIRWAAQFASLDEALEAAKLRGQP